MSALVVYKYKLRPAENLIEMPRGGQLLHVGSQGSEAYVWALVEEHGEAVGRKVLIVPTGIPFTVDESTRHIGTFTIREAGTPEMVFHAFDCGEAS